MLIELRTPVEIQTGLSRAEVIDRLTRSIAPPGYPFALFGPLGIVGRTGPDHCWFESGTFLRRAFRRLTLRYHGDPAGTVLRGQFALPTIRIVPIVAVFGLGTVMCLLFTFRIFKGLVDGTTRLGFWQLIPFIFLCVGFFMVKFNLWLARGSERELIDTLEDLLKGPPASTDGTWPPHPEVVIRPRHEVF